MCCLNSSSISATVGLLGSVTNWEGRTHARLPLSVVSCCRNEQWTYLVIFRHCLPIVYEEHLQCVWHDQAHLGPSSPVIVIPAPFCAASALLTPPSSSLCPASRVRCFGGRGTGRSNSSLRPGEVLLKGKVGFIVFKEARGGDPFVPTANKKMKSERPGMGIYERKRTSASTLCSAPGNAAPPSPALCWLRPKPHP